MGIEKETDLPEAPAFPRLPRRKALLLGGGALAAATAAGFLISGARHRRALPALVGAAKPRAIGEGFFVVDGWVLTEADMKRLGAEPPPSSPER